MISSAFSLPIYIVQASHLERTAIDHEISKKWDEIMQDGFDNPDRWSDKVKTNIEARMNSISDFKLSNLNKFICKHASQYYAECQPIIRRNIFMNQSWFNITDKGEGQNFHQHCDSIISATYHYKTNEEDGEIVFKNPIPFASLGLFPASMIGACKEQVGVRPKEGQLIMFPGWLEHKVIENPTDHRRISIAANFLTDNSI